MGVMKTVPSSSPERYPFEGELFPAPGKMAAFELSNGSVDFGAPVEFGKVQHITDSLLYGFRPDRKPLRLSYWGGTYYFSFPMGSESVTSHTSWPSFENTTPPERDFAARIVASIDTTSPGRRFGFAAAESFVRGISGPVPQVSEDLCCRLIREVWGSPMRGQPGFDEAAVHLLVDWLFFFADAATGGKTIPVAECSAVIDAVAKAFVGYATQDASVSFEVGVKNGWLFLFGYADGKIVCLDYPLDDLLRRNFSSTWEEALKVAAQLGALEELLRAFLGSGRTVEEWDRMVFTEGVLA